jgi:ketosteroid isomerase-like protein
MSDATATIDASDLAAANREVADTVLTLLGSEEQFDFFADDIVMEFPYGESLGMPVRFEGKTDVVAYTRQLNQLLKGLRMRDRTFHSAADDPETVFIEYYADAPTPGGNSYLQIYINKMRIRDGKLVYMREFWDPKRILDARSGVYDASPA